MPFSAFFYNFQPNNAQKIPIWNREESTVLINVCEGTGGCEGQRCQDACVACDLERILNYF
jgi:hypothetical protein